MKFKWNLIEARTTTVWNPSINSESMVHFENSLKERLYQPISGTRDSDHLADIGKGIALIMDYLEQKDLTSVAAIEETPVVKEMTEAEFRSANDGHSWIYADEDCPDCQGSLVKNARGVSCSQRGCGYRK